jgi:hypothetical protein
LQEEQYNYNLSQPLKIFQGFRKPHYSGSVFTRCDENVFKESVGVDVCHCGGAYRATSECGCELAKVASQYFKAVPT